MIINLANSDSNSDNEPVDDPIEEPVNDPSDDQKVDNQPTVVPILNSSLPSGQVSKDYYAELSSTLENVEWTVKSGDLPKGLTLSKNTGVISGVPEKAGTFKFIIQAKLSDRESLRRFEIFIEPEEIIEPQKEISSGGGGCNSGILSISLMFWVIIRPKDKKFLL